MRMLKSRKLLRPGVVAILTGLALGMTAVSGCGSDSGDAPAPVVQEAQKKSMQASGDFYKQQHANKKK